MDSRPWLFVLAAILWLIGGCLAVLANGTRRRVGLLMIAGACLAWAAVLAVELGNNSVGPGGDCTTVEHNGEVPTLIFAGVTAVGICVAVSVDESRLSRLVVLIGWLASGLVIFGGLGYVVSANPTC